MFESFSIIFFVITCGLLFATAACIATFLAIWKTFSLLYDATDSWLLSFFSAGAVAIVISYFWLVVIWFGIPTMV